MEAKFVLPEMIISGIGSIHMPNSPVPPPTSHDMDLDPKVCYVPQWPIISAELMQAWIRRAVHAEAFAKSLESQLEEARQQLRDHDKIMFFVGDNKIEMRD